MTTLGSKTHRFNFSICMLTAMASVLILAALCLIFAAPRANASLPTTGSVNLTSIAAAPKGGFWVQVDGFAKGTESRTLAVYGAPQFANVGDRGSIAAIPGQEGYWVVSAEGRIYARGDAPPLCDGQLSDCSGFPAEPIADQYVVAAAARPDGEGFWTVTVDGKVFTAGSAVSYGDVTNDSQTPTGIVATPSGLGYYIVLEDGGVYSFGDAVFYGSTGGNKPGGHSATGLAPSLNANGQINGYWMVFDDGGVFTFGAAPFLGSSGGNNGGSVVTGIAALPSRFGYAWVHANGSVSFSIAPNMTIASVQFGTVIGLPHGATNPGIPLQLLAANGLPSQQWQLRPTTGPLQPGSVVQLVNVNSGLCADVTGNPALAKIIQYPCKGNTGGRFNQLWTMTTNSDGVTQFEAHGGPDSLPNGYTLAANSNGSLSLVSRSTSNPGWILSIVP